MAFAALLEKEESMGLFQIIHVTLLAIPFTLIPCHNLVQIFSAAIPGHHCCLPTNETHGTDGGCHINLTEGQMRAFIPQDQNQKLESCLRFTSPQWQLLGMNTTSTDATGIETEPCHDGWEYDRSMFTSTIVTQWDLVCDRQSWKEIAQSIFMTGVLLGAFMFGGLADRFGRRTMLLWCSFQLMTMGTGVAFSPNFITYCIFRFLAGMGLSGFIINDYGLTLEWTPTKFRAIVSAVHGYCATLSQLILAGVAYGIRDWHWLQMAISLPFVFVFLWTWWLPESVRWLVMNNKPEVALRNLQRVARINGKMDDWDWITLETLKSEIQKERLKTTSKPTPVDLFRTPAMRRITCCLTLVWFSSSFAFFAVAMDVQKFGINIYLVQLIFGAVEILLRVMGIIAMSYLGRRFTQAFCLFAAGLLVLSSLAVPEGWPMVKISLTALGKGILGSSIVCAYLYTLELFPTTLRQTGMGFTNMMMRLGAVVAPMVLMIKEYVSFLPTVIFGVVPILCGLSVFLLPETLNVSLPDSIDQVESRARTKPIPNEARQKKEEIIFKKTQF